MSKIMEQQSRDSTLAKIRSTVERNGALPKLKYSKRTESVPRSSHCLHTAVYPVLESPIKNDETLQHEKKLSITKDGCDVDKRETLSQSSKGNSIKRIGENSELLDTEEAIENSRKLSDDNHFPCSRLSENSKSIESTWREQRTCLMDFGLTKVDYLKYVSRVKDWTVPSPPVVNIYDTFAQSNRFFAKKLDDGLPLNPSIAGDEVQTKNDVTNVISLGDITSSAIEEEKSDFEEETTCPEEDIETPTTKIAKEQHWLKKDKKVTFREDLNEIFTVMSMTSSHNSRKANHGNAFERLPVIGQKHKGDGVVNSPLPNCDLLSHGHSHHTEKWDHHENYITRSKIVPRSHMSAKPRQKILPTNSYHSNSWKPKVSITWDYDQPMRVRIVHSNPIIRNGFNIREHEDLWPQVKLSAILRMLDGQHYRKEIKRWSL